MSADEINEEYKTKIRALMVKHNLGFMGNPGGGEFTHNHSKLRKPCQVTWMGDYKDDYETLMARLIEAGMEPNE